MDDNRILAFGICVKAEEIIGMLPEVIDKTPDQAAHHTLSELMVKLSELDSHLRQYSQTVPTADDASLPDDTATDNDDDAAIARNAEFEEAQDSAPTPQPAVCADSAAGTAGIKPMIKMFTINDRYRFRRELFGNLDAAMAEALETMSVMDTIEQARQYLEEDLCWDMTLPEVEEFVAAITPYYSQRRV